MIHAESPLTLLAPRTSHSALPRRDYQSRHCWANQQEQPTYPDLHSTAVGRSCWQSTSEDNISGGVSTYQTLFVAVVHGRSSTKQSLTLNVN